MNASTESTDTYSNKFCMCGYCILVNVFGCFNNGNFDLKLPITKLKCHTV